MALGASVLITGAFHEDGYAEKKNQCNKWTKLQGLNYER